MNNILFSIIVCTYNRGYLIEHCLEALAQIDYPLKKFEILLVNNNSTDNTTESCLKYTEKYSHFHYLLVKEIGLSYARNIGAKTARGKYIIYIDDDAIISKNYLSRLEYVIQRYKYKVIGGIGEPWFFYGRPKWISNRFDINYRGFEDIGPLKNGYISGFNMVFEKDTLLSSHMFDPLLGMTGKKIAFGEETKLIDEIRNNGIEIAFDPHLKVKHLVAKHKLKLSWHIKAAYAHGRDGVYLWPNLPHLSYLSMIKVISRKIISSFKQNLPKLFIQKNYYIQNFILDTLCPVYNLFGQQRELNAKKNKE